MMSKVIIVSGATATGKTNLAIELAEKFGGEIVNFDSLLFYQELNIGVAKPTEEELKRVTHHLVGTESIAAPLNAHQFVLKALPIIDSLHQKNKIVYLVGGSGFYLQALIKGMYDSPSTPREILEKSNQLYLNEGINPFIEILKNHDPKALELFHFNDHYRVRRAVEHFWSHATPYSSQRELHLTRKSLAEEKGWDILHCYLNIPKDEHAALIIKRTELMIQNGFKAEVENLLHTFSGAEKPLKSIGYKEMIASLRGEIQTPAECFEKICFATRRLAKAQRTWFNRIVEKITIHPKNDFQLALNTVENFIKEKK